MKNLVVLTFFALVFLHGFETFAWGKRGHEIIAEIAFSRLNPETRNNILKYLDGLTIQQASTWMDDVRNDPTYKSLNNAHFINIPYTLIPDTDVKRELEKTFQELENKKFLSDSAIRIDILKIIHLIGDLHQPLHTGYEIDKGGNTISVDFFGKKSNLHRVWDSQIIEKAEIDSAGIENYLIKFTQNELATISIINVDAWIEESQSYLTPVYSMENNTIDDSYISNSMPIIVSRIAKAALRLQKTLELYFSASA